MLYIQKSVSENAGIAVIGVEKYKNFLGEIKTFLRITLVIDFKNSRQTLL